MFIRRILPAALLACTVALPAAAEMSDAEKNAISHRGRAFRMLVEACFR